MPVPIYPFLNFQKHSLISVDLSQAYTSRAFVHENVSGSDFQNSCKQLHFLLNTMHWRVYHNLVQFVATHNIYVLVTQFFQTDFLSLSWIILFEAYWELTCIVDKYVLWLWLRNGFESLSWEQLSAFKKIDVVGWFINKQTLRIQMNKLFPALFT